MSVPFQPSLFGFGDPMADTSFGTLHRFQLDSESWVDLAPGWLRGADNLFTTLAESAPWQRRERWMYDHRVAEPRLTCGWTVADAPPPLDDLGRMLSQHYCVGFDSIWANYYRDGNDSVAWRHIGVAGRPATPICLHVGVPSGCRRGAVGVRAGRPG